MKRLGTSVLSIAVLALCVACGDDDPQPETKDSGPVVIPMPRETPAEAAERARGFYVGDLGDVHATLELRADRRFTFISQRGRDVRRASSGTWSVAGVRLTLAYTHIGEEPIEGGPKTIINVWRGDTIELRETGLSRTVMLTKRTAIRIR